VNRLSLAALLGPCLLALAGAGCKASEPEAHWVQYEVPAQNDRLLMEVTAMAVQKSGFPIGSGIDPGHLTLVSGWHTSLAPFRGAGFREQCEVKYDRIVPRRYQASIRVRREKNDDILRPLDITYAQWKQEPDDYDRARTVMQHIRSLLDTDVEVGSKP
jgi:hypothetical protein